MDKTYIKGNINALLSFAGKISYYALLLQLKRKTSTGVILNYKKLLRENKFCVSYATALAYIKYLHEQGYLRATKKDLYLLSYDAITTQTGNDPSHSNFYMEAKEDIKLYLEALILKSSADRQNYSINKRTDYAQQPIKVTKLTSRGLTVIEQRPDDDIFLTCKGFSDKLERKSKLTGHRHFRKLERANLIHRTPRFTKTEIGDKKKSRYLFGELYHIIPYGLTVNVRKDCRKLLRHGSKQIMSVDDSIAWLYTGEFD